MEIILENLDYLFDCGNYKVWLFEFYYVCGFCLDLIEEFFVINVSICI